MLSLFPQILFLAPLGTTIIRVAAGIVMIYFGYSFWRESALVAEAHVPLIGHPPKWLAKLGGVVYMATGVLLFIGLYTQVVAIIAGIVGLKCFIWGKRYQKIIPISRTASFLLFAICLCLLVTGAGVFAFDLPL